MKRNKQANIEQIECRPTGRPAVTVALTIRRLYLPNANHPLESAAGRSLIPLPCPFRRLYYSIKARKVEDVVPRLSQSS
jgi:hypothetical protein